MLQLNESCVEDRKKRGKTFSDLEKWTLVEMYEKYREVLLSRDGKAETVKRKNIAWKEVNSCLFINFSNLFIKQIKLIYLPQLKLFILLISYVILFTQFY